MYFVDELRAKVKQTEGYSRTMLFDRGTSFDVTPDGQRFILRLR